MKTKTKPWKGKYIDLFFSFVSVYLHDSMLLYSYIQEWIIKLQVCHVTPNKKQVISWMFSVGRIFIKELHNWRKYPEQLLYNYFIVVLVYKKNKERPLQADTLSQWWKNFYIVFCFSKSGVMANDSIIAMATL